ncbi:peptidase M48 [Geotalea uraniireducens]|uniref:Peptidase M48 n=1 Tax=Geotalea uraniireducens TaxID=351604 RepID=A0ABM8EJD0_9BACT|nr:zinc metalloprotease HtpX [Geotalea uraniireducens]BDV42506.1 peptidase M48 [Geotalea uraniireducens]
MSSLHWHNLLRSILLVTGMMALLLALGWLFAGIYGMIWVLLVGVIPLVVSVRVFPTLILRMYRARPITAEEAPQLHRSVRQLAAQADLARLPQLYYIPSAAPLIFSVGQGDNAAIAVADGLLRLLTYRELVGVLGHELSHIRNSDTWVMSLADVMSRVTRMLSLFGQLLVLVNLPLFLLGQNSLPWIPLLLMMLAPTASALLQLSLSRTREYEADLDGSRISGDPAGLAAALAKLEDYQQRLLAQSRMLGKGQLQPSLLRTHPLTGERIERLRTLEAQLQPPGARLICPDDGGPCFPAAEAIRRKPRRHFTGLWH